MAKASEPTPHQKWGWGAASTWEDARPGASLAQVLLLLESVVAGKALQWERGTTG